MPDKKDRSKGKKAANQAEAVQPIQLATGTFIFKPTSSTPFDDVFKTTLHDHTRLVIPLINKAFNENYTGDEHI